MFRNGLKLRKNFSHFYKAYTIFTSYIIPHLMFPATVCKDSKSLQNHEVISLLSQRIKEVKP